MLTNKLILGTVQMGIPYGINNHEGQIKDDDSFKILNASFEKGVRCLDTAESYGTAHKIIGGYHKSHPDKIFDVITKLPRYIDDNIDEKIKSYLEELNVVKLKGLLFHSYHTYKENQSSIELLSKYKNDGKVENIGVSVYTNSELEDVIEDDYIDMIQLPFNLFDNLNLRGEIILKAKSRGKIIHTRSVFLQGLFFASLTNTSKVVQALIEPLSYIHELSRQANISIQKIALNYCLQQTNIDNVLIGVDNLNQLNQNLKDADYTLLDEIVNAVNKILINNIDLLNPSLWNQ